MKNPKLTWKIINSLNGFPILLYLFTLMHWPVFYRFTMVHIIIMIAVIYGLKSWAEVKYNISSPIKNNKIIKMMYFISGALVLIGFLFRVLHWPFSNIATSRKRFDNPTWTQIWITSHYFQWESSETQDMQQCTPMIRSKLKRKIG